MAWLNFKFWRKGSKTLPVRQVKPKSRRSDVILVSSTILLSLFGLLMVYNSSVAIALRDFADPYHFVRDQGRWLVFGLLIFSLAARLDYRLWYKLALPLLGLSLILLVLVFIPGLGLRALGAHRWLNFRFLVVQPAELAKLTLLIYLSAWLAFPEKSRLGTFLLLVMMVVGLVVAEPDLGTGVIILASALILYFLSGAPLKNFLVLLPLVVGSLIILAVVSPYRLSRLTAFFNPEKDPLGSSYQIRQATLALGSGGWWGIGIGKSRQKYEYLPEANTDSIFAIIGEEYGFIGATVLILGYLLVIWRGFRIGIRAPDRFGNLLAWGISAWLAVQFGINIAANVALIPLTGVPLPLISYGGSNLVVILAALGILANISKQR